MPLVHLVRPTPWKHWPMRLNSYGPSPFCASDSRVKIFDLKSSSVYARKYSVPNQAWLGATWQVISLEFESLEFFLEEILICLCCFRPSLISLSGMPLAPKDVQQVYQLNWRILRLDKIWHCHNLYFSWFGSRMDLIAFLLDRAGLCQQEAILIVMYALVGEQIRGWNIN